MAKGIVPFVSSTLSKTFKDLSKKVGPITAALTMASAGVYAYNLTKGTNASTNNIDNINNYAFQDMNPKINL